MNSLEPSKIDTSRDDVELLSRLGLDAKQVAEKICSTVIKAQEIYDQNKDCEVSLDDQIKVTFLNVSMRGEAVCGICQHKTEGPGLIEIENTDTKARIVFNEHCLHQLKEHVSFGVGSYRVDPIVASEILGLK